MAAGRSQKSLVGRRRRADEEGEDDDGPVVVEDSLSEGSILSEPDDGDADASSLGDPGSAEARNSGARPENPANGLKSGKKLRKPRKKSKKAKEPEVQSAEEKASFKQMADTDAMMNGLRMDNEAPEPDVVDFETMGQNGDNTMPIPTSSGPRHGSAESFAHQNRREHEEYKKQRDADPAFIPNRGNFFMHDTRGRTTEQGPAPTRGVWATRGKGRGASSVGGPFSPANQAAPIGGAEQEPWKHDLHDTINEEPPPVPAPTRVPDRQRDRDEIASARTLESHASPMAPTQSSTLSFSSATLVGKVQIRVLLPGMSDAIVFSEVPWKHYVRLPDHRPPLRRDKPVRVYLPAHPPRYIFPSNERSFIFIPRQMRPNQQSFGRGSYQRGIGGYGYSSRRTSIFGGSVYSASIAPSRRSSIAGIGREKAFSPSSFGSGMAPATKPLIRLPQAGGPFSAVTTPSGPLSGQHTPVGMPQLHTYSLPQQPTYQGTPTDTVYQPKPQKAISVSGIESPATLQQAPQSTNPQLFQNQLPAHMNEPPQPAYNLPPPQYFSPRQQYAYPQQPNSGTPLSGIPEQAMHATSFQPPPMQFGAPPYFAHYPPQQPFYYSPPRPSGYAPMPMYVPPQGYMMPPAPQSVVQQRPPPDSKDEQHDREAQPSQSGMVAHESNGMVFYLPASEAQQQEQGQNYQPAEGFVPSYALPGLPPPTPAPETSYYYPMQPVYYPPQQP